MATGRKNRKFDQALGTLFGGKVPKKFPPIYNTIAECLASPDLLPNNIESIIGYEGIEDMRVALARVQIDSELRMKQDVEYFNRRLWVAQTIERMVFGGLIIEGEKLKGSDDDDDDD